MTGPPGGVGSKVTYHLFKIVDAIPAGLLDINTLLLIRLGIGLGLVFIQSTS